MKRINIPNEITSVHPREGHILHLGFDDGAEFDLDFEPLISREAGSPLIDPLRKVEEFKKMKIDYGTIVFSTGYDICPDVLRFWCEQGRVCSREETNAYFEHMPAHTESAGK